SMVGAAGENLTQQYLDQYAPKIDYSKHWDKVESSAYVAEGAQGKDVKAILYVFKDPNCGFCHSAWKAFQPYMKVGLQVRWIPVSFLAPDSFDKSAALLTAKDKNLALQELHNNFGKKTEVAPASPQLREKINAN